MSDRTLNNLAHELIETNKAVAEIANLILILKQWDEDSVIPAVAARLSTGAKQRIERLTTLKQ